MRPLLLTLLCSLVAVPAALAAPRATGDGVLELQAVYGSVQIGSAAVPAKGTAWGQMDGGTLKVVDPTGPTDGIVMVSGYDTKVTTAATDTTPRLVTYKGHNLHFRVTGGKYRLFFNGAGIDLTAVGVGVATLKGDSKAVDPGSYAVDSGDWLPVPLAGDPTASPVPFGTQPATPSP